MSDGARALAQLACEELFRPAPPHAERLAAAIRERVGEATAAVVFYGSCLRRGTPEGVLDFYVIVDDWPRASRSRWLAWAGRGYPPNVFYLETGEGEAALRCKYAVLSRDDLARGAAGGFLRTGIWARFCQPLLAVFSRDEAAREALVAACSESVVTAVSTVAPLLPGPATPRELWDRVFAETYAREMRSESEATVASLQAAAPERFERALRAALEELEARRGWRVRWTGPRFDVDLSEEERERARRRWRLRRPLAKAAYVGQLFKTAFTFGDWLPYALWKVERHTGRHIETTERQRRHPLVFGWPLLYQVLRNNDRR